MKIKYNATATTSDLTADSATLDSKALYPAQWKNSFTAVGGTDKAGASDGVYQFETAYGTSPAAEGYAMKEDTLKAVGAPAAAVTSEYAVANVFNISSKGTDLENLKVSGASIESGDTGNASLDSALRVLVCTVDESDAVTNWVLCDKDGVLSDSEGRARGQEDCGKFGDGVTVEHDKDTKVIAYVYYDGNDAQIYSNNLPSPGNSSSKLRPILPRQRERLSRYKSKDHLGLNY